MRAPRGLFASDRGGTDHVELLILVTLAALAVVGGLLVLSSAVRSKLDEAAENVATLAPWTGNDGRPSPGAVPAASGAVGDHHGLDENHGGAGVARDVIVSAPPQVNAAPIAQALERNRNTITADLGLVPMRGDLGGVSLGPPPLPSSFLLDGETAMLANEIWAHVLRTREMPLGDCIDGCPWLNSLNGWSWTSTLFTAARWATSIRYHGADGIDITLSKKYSARQMADVEHFYFAALVSAVVGSAVALNLSVLWDLAVSPIQGGRWWSAYDLHQFATADVPGVVFGRVLSRLTMVADRPGETTDSLPREKKAVDGRGARSSDARRLPGDEVAGHLQ